MKTVKNFAVPLLAAAIVVMAGFRVMAQNGNEPSPPAPPRHENPPPPPPPPPPLPPDRSEICGAGIADLPGLTGQQTEDLRKADLKQMKDMTVLKNQIRECISHLATLLVMDDPDAGDLERTIMKMGDLGERRLKLQIAYDREIRNLLTPEQRILFDMRPKPFLREN